MRRRMWGFVVYALLLLLAPVFVVSAQGPPDAINDALADLSARAGAPITLDILSNWQWEQLSFPDTSLNCPQPGQTYAQTITNGYRFLLTYNGVTYDYRVSADRRILVLCTNPPAQQPTATSQETTTTPGGAVTPTPTPEATLPDFPQRLVCSDAMPTRLSTGTPGRVLPGAPPVNLYSSPTRTAPVAGQIPGGETFTVVDGPQCAEGLVWWQIDYDTLIGWTAEGQSGMYWLAPVVSAQTPEPSSAVPDQPQIYDLPANRQVISAANVGQLSQLLELPLAAAITEIAWSPDGTTLAAAELQGIWLYSTASFRLPPRLLQVPNGPVHDITFSAGQNIMASAHEDTTVRLWDVTIGGQRAVLRGHSQPVQAVAFSPDDVLLASAGNDSSIYLWDVATGTQAALLQEGTEPISDIAFSPDGTLLAEANEDGSIRLWDIVSGTLATVLTGHYAPVRAVVFSPDGTRLASGGGDGTVQLWDIATGENITLEGHGNRVLALAFNADGSLLVSAGGGANGPGDNSLRLWDTTTGDQLALLENYGAAPEAVVEGLEFSPDGTVLIFVAVQPDQSMIWLWGVTQ